MSEAEAQAQARAATDKEIYNVIIGQILCRLDDLDTWEEYRDIFLEANLAATHGRILQQMMKVAADIVDRFPVMEE